MTTAELIAELIAVPMVLGVIALLVSTFILDGTASHKNLTHRAMKDHEFLQNSYFDAASGIMRETMKHSKR